MMDQLASNRKSEICFRLFGVNIHADKPIRDGDFQCLSMENLNHLCRGEEIDEKPQMFKYDEHFSEVLHHQLHAYHEQKKRAGKVGDVQCSRMENCSYSVEEEEEINKNREIEKGYYFSPVIDFGENINIGNNRNTIIVIDDPINFYAPESKITYSPSSSGHIPPTHPFHDKKNKGKPWTEQEHKYFLCGLKKLGKGNWKEISNNYVRTKTPTQVASHAQKYFLRIGSYQTRKRRRSLFDMSLEEVGSSSKS